MPNTRRAFTHRARNSQIDTTQVGELKLAFGNIRFMKIYLAGPDIFRPDADVWAEQVRTLCRHYGYDPLLPLDHGETTPEGIFEANLKLIKKAQIVAANLDPFRGSEPDSGTCFEVGYSHALGKKVCGYVTSWQTTVERLGKKVRDRQGTVVDTKGYAVENFGLPANLMLAISCHIVDGGLEGCLHALRARTTSLGQAG